MSQFGFVFDVSFIIITFLILNHFKSQLVNYFEKITSKNVFLFSIFSSIPFILIEESINCIDWGDGFGCRMTLWINVILFIQIIVLVSIIKKKKITEIKKPLLIYAGIGLVWEVLFGGLRGFTLSPFILFMGPYVMLSYAYIALIPVTIMVVKNRKNN